MALPEFKVVFPAPPPTTNELTAQQRTQLVRKTRKIEQLLGMTPRLIDASNPIHISFSYGLSQRRLSKARRSSVDSTSSGSSSGSISAVQRSPSLSSTTYPTNSSTGPNRHSNSAHTFGEPFQSWAYDNDAPLLRLAMESMTLETIPASPSPTQDSFADASAQLGQLANSNDESSSRVFTLTAQDVPSPRSSFILTTKVIPSSNSLRKQKMDRLRKKLGSDVPYDLVFPNSKDNDTTTISATRSENTPPLPPAVWEKEQLDLSVPRPRAQRKQLGRISTSRDSISDASSIHRARRQAHATAAAKESLKHKKSRSDPTSSSLPPPPPPPPSVLLHSEFKRIKEKLSFIIESPDEHGASGCTEEFGLSRASSSKDRDLTSGWVIKSHETEFNFWSTRRGYEGWNSTLANLSPVSTCSLSSLDDCSSMSSADPPPITPISPALPSSSSPTNATSGELKKRPSSYRKPPPPVPADCCFL